MAVSDRHVIEHKSVIAHPKQRRIAAWQAVGL
jgi:hypothetical protein